MKDEANTLLTEGYSARYAFVLECVQVTTKGWFWWRKPTGYIAFLRYDDGFKHLPPATWGRGPTPLAAIQAAMNDFHKQYNFQ